MQKEEGRTIKPATRRVRMLVKRAVLKRAQAGKLYRQAEEAVCLAQTNGLRPGQTIEIEIPGEAGSIEKTSFELVDNFAGERVSRSATVHRFELKKLPKFKRSVPSPEDVTP